MVRCQKQWVSHYQHNPNNFLLNKQVTKLILMICDKHNRYFDEQKGDCPYCMQPNVENWSKIFSVITLERSIAHVVKLSIVLHVSISISKFILKC